MVYKNQISRGVWGVVYETYTYSEYQAWIEAQREMRKVEQLKEIGFEKPCKSKTIQKLEDLIRDETIDKIVSGMPKCNAHEDEAMLYRDEVISMIVNMKE